MSADEIRKDVEAAIVEAGQAYDDLYGYYLVLRGPSIGAMPRESVASVTFDRRTYNAAVETDVWGWVGYAEPLSKQDVSDYELIPDEHNPIVYARWAVGIKELVVDANGKKNVSSRYLQDPNGEVFFTNYKGVAEHKAASLNEVALDTNNREHITMARVVEIKDH